MNKKKIKAFTMSEVLVSLTVIGVIAALTLPALNISARKNANAQGCKKAYVVLSEAVDIAKIDEPFDKWTFDDDHSTEIYNKFKNNIVITKECINTSGCWNANIKQLNQEAATGHTNNGYGTPYIAFKTADGMNVTMDITGEKFNVPSSRTNTLIFYVDVNGDNAPNRIGDDIFVFVLGDDALLPGGTNASGNGNCTRSGVGTDCAARVLNEGKINY